MGTTARSSRRCRLLNNNYSSMQQLILSSSMLLVVITVTQMTLLSALPTDQSAGGVRQIRSVIPSMSKCRTRLIVPKGNCTKSNIGWTFNGNFNKCLPLFSCRGRGNYFETMADCKAACIPNGLPVDVVDDEEGNDRNQRPSKSASIEEQQQDRLDYADGSQAAPRGRQQSIPDYYDVLPRDNDDNIEEDSSRQEFVPIQSPLATFPAANNGGGRRFQYHPGQRRVADGNSSSTPPPPRVRLEPPSSRVCDPECPRCQRCNLRMGECVQDNTDVGCRRRNTCATAPPCPPCHNCQVNTFGEARCVRLADCCEDGTKPKQCEPKPSCSAYMDECPWLSKCVPYGRCEGECSVQLYDDYLYDVSPEACIPQPIPTTPLPSAPPPPRRRRPGSGGGRRRRFRPRTTSNTSNNNRTSSLATAGDERIPTGVAPLPNHPPPTRRERRPGGRGGRRIHHAFPPVVVEEERGHQQSSQRRHAHHKNSNESFFFPSPTSELPLPDNNWDQEWTRQHLPPLLTPTSADTTPSAAPTPDYAEASYPIYDDGNFITTDRSSRNNPSISYDNSRSSPSRTRFPARSHHHQGTYPPLPLRRQRGHQGVGHTRNHQRQENQVPPARRLRPVPVPVDRLQTFSPLVPKDEFFEREGSFQSDPTRAPIQLDRGAQLLKDDSGPQLLASTTATSPSTTTVISTIQLNKPNTTPMTTKTTTLAYQYEYLCHGVQCPGPCERCIPKLDETCDSSAPNADCKNYECHKDPTCTAFDLCSVTYCPETTTCQLQHGIPVCLTQEGLRREQGRYQHRARTSSFPSPRRTTLLATHNDAVLPLHQQSRNEQYGRTRLSSSRSQTGKEVTENRLNKTRSECLQDLDTGRTCSAGVKAYFYDTKDGYCKAFKFGGCGGNLNRFSTLQWCNRVCIEKRDCTMISDLPKPKNVPYGCLHELVDGSDGCLKYTLVCDLHHIPIERQTRNWSGGKSQKLQNRRRQPISLHEKLRQKLFKRRNVQRFVRRR